MNPSEEGFRFFVDLISVDRADTAREEGKSSVVSIVVQQVGLPNSFPVADMWYHKVMIANRPTMNATAKELVEDLTARCCVYFKSSNRDCPQEKFEPKLSAD
jgi:hypothetical protein